MSTHTLSEEESGFCSRFDLPTSEVPFPDWQGGRRCTLIDRDRPLMGSRGGRLYLTYSFLCFERFSMRSRDSDRLVLPLSDITVIEKVCYQLQWNLRIMDTLGAGILSFIERLKCISIIGK